MGAVAQINLETASFSVLESIQMVTCNSSLTFCQLCDHIAAVHAAECLDLINLGLQIVHKRVINTYVENTVTGHCHQSIFTETLQRYINNI